MICKVCSGPVSLAYMEPTKTQLRTRQLCFSCNFWTEYLDKQNRPNHVIVASAYDDKAHDHFVIGPETNSTIAMKGHGGRKFIIRFKDGREVTTTNLWSQGTIPDRFKDRFKVNAEIIS